MNLFKSIRRLILRHQLSVVLDPNDNSITFDPPLVRNMKILEQSEAYIYTFRVNHKGREYYAFAMNPSGIDSENTVVSSIMIDDRTGDIGYECLTPGVSRICYDYQLTFDKPTRLTVKKAVSDGIYPITYYRIIPPKRTKTLESSQLDALRSSDTMQNIILENNKRQQQLYEDLRQEAYERMNRNKNNQKNG